MDIGFRAPFTSLGARLFAMLLLAVAVVLAAYATISYRTTREHLVEIVSSDAHRMSQLIHRATHYAMLLNEKDDVRRMLEEIGKGAAVETVRVFDKEGRIVFASEQQEDGPAASLDQDPCLHCHASDTTVTEAAWDLEIVALGRPDGVEVFRHIDVIPNQEGCAGSECHASPEEEKVLGVLDLQMSTAPLRSTLRHAQRQILGTTVVLMTILGLLAAVFVHRVVQRPVAALAEGTRRIAEGDLDTPLEIRGAYELSRLAEDFNSMTSELRSARREVVTWSQMLEERVVEKTEELRRAQRQVLHMERMASLGKLAATVAHELNNPISGMLTYARLVERGLEPSRAGAADPQELIRYLRLIQKECSRCGEIVKNLLLFARHSGSEMRPVNLEEILERSWMLVRHHLEISGIQHESVVTLDDPQIVADAGQIEQALLALMMNAVESMEGSEGTLTVTVDGDDQEIRLMVKDTGIGIDPEMQRRIFEPFFSTKHAESGVGLGLAVVYGIVKRHGGDIEVRSQPGQGAEFHLRWPRRPPAEAVTDPTSGLEGAKNG